MCGAELAGLGEAVPSFPQALDGVAQGSSWFGLVPSFILVREGRRERTKGGPLKEPPSSGMSFLGVIFSSFPAERRQVSFGPRRTPQKWQGSSKEIHVASI